MPAQNATFPIGSAVPPGLSRVASAALAGSTDANFMNASGNLLLSTYPQRDD